MYYIVRRAFRDKQGPLPVGSIVEPTGVRNFKYRLGEQHIVQVNEQNYERYANLFLERFGVVIPKLTVLEAPAEPAEPAEPVKPVTPVVQVSKPVVTVQPSKPVAAVYHPQ